MAEASGTKDRALKLHKRACVAEEAGLLDTALVLIDQAIDLCPKATVFQTTKALFLFDAGRHKEAEIIARQSVQINNKNYFGWELLAEISMERGEFGEAIKYLKNFVNLRDEYWAHTILAALEADFDRVSAIEHAERALELNPDWDEAKQILHRLRKSMDSV